MAILEGDGLTRILTPGSNGNDNFGGGGVLMGLILGAALGGGGLFGGNNREERCVNQADLNGQTLGDIKASVPLAEAQVQLAMQGLQSYLSQQANVNATTAASTACADTRDILLNQCSSFAGVQRDIASVDTNVDKQSTMIQQQIFRDGEATRSLITSNTIAELNQRLTVAQQEALELRQRNERERDRSAVEIQMTNNQNQLQTQQQLQFQAINHQLNGLYGHINQFNRATNSTVQVGNTGAATAGPQNANPTNVVA